MKSYTLLLTLSAPRGTSVFCRIEDDSGLNYKTYLASIPFNNQNKWFEKFLLLWRNDKTFKELTLEQCKNFGESLYKALFKDDIKLALEQAREKTRNCGYCRLALRLEEPRLFKTPFELLHDGSNFLQSSGVRIIRVLSSAHGRQAGFRPLKRMVILLSEPTSPNLFWGREQHLEDIKKIFGTIRGPGNREIELVPIIPATFEKFDRVMRDRMRKRQFFDAAYIVAHGTAKEGEEPKLILETDQRKESPVPASRIAETFREHPGCFVLLNACSSSQTTDESSHSGLAQRLIADGRAGAVLAMQRRILTCDARKIAQCFFSDIVKGDFAEDAANHARTMLIDHHRSAVPTFYTQLRGPEQQEAERIANLLDVDDNHCKLDVLLPFFRMGLLKAEYETRLQHSDNVPAIEPKTYHYRGETIAKTDHDTAWLFVQLYQKALGAIDTQGEIRFRDADSPIDKADASHYLLIGSRSQSKLPNILRHFSTDFDFSYSDNEGLWKLTDKRTNEVYTLKAPQDVKDITKEDYITAQDVKDPTKEDYILIEKLKREEQTFFVLAGFTDEGTYHAADFLVKKWSDLQIAYGGAPFQRLLHWNREVEGFGVEVVNREVDPIRTSKD